MYTFIAAAFPDEPGVYLMQNDAGRIIYVGKAKSLRKRLASYFVAPERLTPKTRVMVERIHHIDVLLASTEKEALLLEESLIKKHRPRYNIVLRDDKKYVLFRLDKRRDYPRLVMTRRIRRGASHYGPYTSAAAARETWRIVNRVFPLRKCSQRSFKNRIRPCLYYHMGQCMAPCVKQVPPERYAAVVRRVEMLLSGRSGELAAQLEQEMRQASDEMEFERAAILRDQIAAIRDTVEKQAMVAPGGGDLDAVGLEETERGLALGLVFVRGGRLIGHRHFFFPGLGAEEGAEVLEACLVQFYRAERDIAPIIVVPWRIHAEPLAEVLAERKGAPVRVKTPDTAKEKHLVGLARKNARRQAAASADRDVSAVLGNRLGLPGPAERVEGVDVSHLSGSGTRAGMVVFEQGRPVPGDYRAWALEELEGSGDDYLALAQWASRRIEAGPPWPDLVLVDGGRGQLAAVHRVVEEAGLAGEIELASIAKAGRAAGELEDRIFRPGRKNHLPLKPGSPELLFLQRVRDTAHDFVLGRQRAGRRKRTLDSRLLELPGIGPKTARMLWDRFGNLDAMAAAGPDDLRELPGMGERRAARVHAALQGLAK